MTQLTKDSQWSWRKIDKEIGRSFFLHPMMEEDIRDLARPNIRLVMLHGTFIQRGASFTEEEVKEFAEGVPAGTLGVVEVTVTALD